MSTERDAWQLLIQMGELPGDEHFSPGLAADGTYTDRLRSVRVRQQLTEELEDLDPSKPKTTQAKLRDLEQLAEEQLQRPFNRRLMHLRQAARDAGLSLRDGELQALLSEAQRRRDGLEMSVGEGGFLDLTPVPWLVEGLILKGALNLLVAPEKAGKTSLMLSLFSRWHRGAEQFLGLPLVGPCPPVLILGPDQPGDDWGRMLLAEGLLSDRGQLAGPVVDITTAKHGWLLDEAGINFVVDRARRHPGLLVLIDSLRGATRLTGVDENDAAADLPVRALIAAIDGTGATVVLIHHANKGSRSQPRSSPCASSRGSSAIPAAASQVIGMQWLNQPKEDLNPEPDKGDRRIVLKTEGRGGRPIELLVERSPDWGWISHGDASAAQRERRLQAAEDRLTDRQAEVLERVRARASEGLRTAADDVLDLIDGRDPGRSARSTLEQLTEKGLLVAETRSVPQGRRRTYQPTQRKGGTPSPCGVSLPPSPSSLNESQPVSIAENHAGELVRRVGIIRSLPETHGMGRRVDLLSDAATGFGDALLPLEPPQVGSGADAQLDADDPAWGPPPAA